MVAQSSSSSSPSSSSLTEEGLAGVNELSGDFGSLVWPVGGCFLRPEVLPM